jgi:release factor glutamine methyltransferase
MSKITLNSAIRALAARFEDADMETPELDARVLALAAAGLQLNDLIREPQSPLDPIAIQKLGNWGQRRIDGEPVARLLGTKEFWGLDFTLSKDTLVPRPDSETLIETAITNLPSGPWRVLDLGTGSGCLLLALLHTWPQATGTGVDLSPCAIDIAALNAAQLGLSARAHFVVSNWDTQVEGCFDLVISNPPYIPTQDIITLAREVRYHDPLQALDGGEDGLDAYRKITGIAAQRLTTGGHLLLELGIGQDTDVCALVKAAGFACVGEIQRDLGGIPRVLHGIKI